MNIQLTAGDTLRIKFRDVARGGDWKWHLHLRINSENLVFPTSIAGNEIQARVAPEITRAWEPGSYSWAIVASSEQDADQATVTGGQVVVIQAGTAADSRTMARRLLDAVEARLEGRITADVQTLAYRGRSIQHIPISELMVLRDRFAAEAQRQEAGYSVFRKVQLRFTR